MKQIGQLALSLLLLPGLSASGFAQRPAPSGALQGSICVTAVPGSNQESITLANPGGGGRDFAYSIKIDDAPPKAVSHVKGIKFSGLALNRSHTIKIIRGGKVVESFKFSFEKEKSSRLCLWFKSLYETWSLWDANSARHLCDCS